ncbi:unnamed protein product [Dovyalis caffra]|uniref:F-box domain-containing protein n=1 Tax=Dovyalis caffra TaxID=77055 RepID=A0AAV1S1V8_9ROSI|nr:unnamed protein product [Dovyalis caffra]
MIAEILCRLTAKELLCCRSVSKPWCALIDGPSFIKLHLKHSMDTSSNLYIILRTTSHVHYMGFDQNLVLNDCVTLKELNHPLMCYNHGIKVLGSVNGLLCISNVVDDIALWNPSIRKHRVVPFLPIELKRYFGTKSCHVYVFGFGYDCVRDDYKVVRIAQFGGGGMRSFESEVKVYSLRKQSWRRIGDMPYCVHYPGANGVFAGGALHWVVGENPESNVANIVVALDLEAEDYKVVPQPENKDKNFNIDLGVLRGCLCFLANFQGERVDVWTMKEYGVKESWTKLFSVARLEFIGFLRTLKPLAYSKSGDEVLIEHDNFDLYWYDLKRQRVKNRIPGIPYSFVAETFVESLISLNPNRHLDGRTQDENEELKDRNKRDDFLSEGNQIAPTSEKPQKHLVLRFNGKFGRSAVPFDKMGRYVRMSVFRLQKCNLVESSEPCQPEITADILSRLPVKALKRFRCVSKSWCKEIESPYFLTMHLQKSSQAHSNLGLILGDIFSTELNTVDLEKLNLTSVELFESNRGRLIDTIALYNPSTREEKVLPFSHSELHIPSGKVYDEASWEWTLYGFGYDPMNEDNKLVKIVDYYGDTLDKCFFSEVKVYSLKSNSWKRIKGYPYYSIVQSEHHPDNNRVYGVFANSAVHWAASTEMIVQCVLPNIIVAFDFGVEGFRTIPKPADYLPNEHHYFDLGVLGGRLSLLCTKIGLYVKIWVMKEYGVKES